MSQTHHALSIAQDSQPQGLSDCTTAKIASHLIFSHRIPYPKRIAAISVAASLAFCGSLQAAETDDSGMASADTETVEVMSVAGQRLRREQVGIKTDTDLKLVPQSITVIDQETLVAQQLRHISDALRLAGAAQGNVRLLTPSADNTRIRGFAAEQLLDGFSQYYNPGDRESVVNVASIAVLKGSNGLLYSGGAGTPVGGVIALESLMPEDTAEYQLGVRLGSHALVQGIMDTSQPLTEHWSARINAEYTQSDWQVDPLALKRFNINPTLAYRDADNTLVIRAKFSRWQQQDYQGLPATGTIIGEDKVDPTLFIGPTDLPESESEFNGVTVHWQRAIGEWQWTLAGRVAEASFSQYTQTLLGKGLDFGADIPWVSDPDLAEQLGYGRLPYVLYNAAMHQEQSELSVQSYASRQWQSGQNKHTLLVGLDASRYDDEGFLAAAPVLTTNSFGSKAIAIVDLLNPEFLPFVMPTNQGADQEVVNQISGVYAQWQYDVGRWHWLAGLRVGQVSIDYTSPDRNDHTKETKFLPRFGVTFDVNSTVSAFVSYSSGVRGQPFAQFSRAPLPEESAQVEVGLKAESSSWTANIAAYKIDRENVAVPDPDGFLGSVAEGKQASTGVDAEATWFVQSDLQLQLNYAYTKATIEDNRFSYAQKGDRLAGVPTHSGRAWLQYQWQVWNADLRAGFGAIAQSSARVSQRNDIDIPGFWRVDASIVAQWQHHEAALAVQNLLNHDYFMSLGYFGSRVAPADDMNLVLSYRYLW